MSAFREELNIGQGCCERFGNDAALSALAPIRAPWAAAPDWDGGMIGVSAFDHRNLAERSRGVVCVGKVKFDTIISTPAPQSR